MKNQRIKLAIVDDEELLVRLLKDFLADFKCFEVCLTALNGEEFLKKIRALENCPDVVLMDLRMKDMGGLELLHILKEEKPDMRVIVISSYYRKSFFGYLLKAGVSAFIPKGISPDKLYDIVTTVYEKGIYLMDEQIETLRKQISSSAPEPVFNSIGLLSKREVEVLQLICQQLTATEIAKRLFINKRTVEGHRNNLFLKTGVKNTAGLVIYALQNKLIDLNDFHFEGTTNHSDC